MFMNYGNIVIELKKIGELIINNITQLEGSKLVKWWNNICGNLMVIRYSGFYLK